MYKYKTFTTTLAIVALLGANSNALAGGSVPTVTQAASRPGEPTPVSLRTHGPAIPRDDAQDAGLTKIVTTFTQYKNSPYWGWLGYPVFGPGAHGGTQWWFASPFTPKANHVATRVEVAGEYDYGTNSVDLALYDDAAGIPGKSLHTWHLTNLPHAICCSVVGGSDKSGIALTGGKQYWVVMKTDAKETDSTVLWAVTEFANVQEHGSTFAIYCTGPGCPSSWNQGWNLQQHMLYGFAYDVLGN